MAHVSSEVVVLSRCAVIHVASSTFLVELVSSLTSQASSIDLAHLTSLRASLTLHRIGKVRRKAIIRHAS